MLFTNNNSMSLCENMVIDFILNEDENINNTETISKSESKDENYFGPNPDLMDEMKKRLRFVDTRLKNLYNMQSYLGLKNNNHVSSVLSTIQKYDLIKKVRSICLVHANGKFLNIAEMYDENSQDDIIKKFIEISYNPKFDKVAGDIEFEKTLEDIKALSPAIGSIVDLVENVYPDFEDAASQLIRVKDEIMDYEDTNAKLLTIQTSFIDTMTKVFEQCIKRIQTPSWSLGDMYQTFEIYKSHYRDLLNKFTDNLQFLKKSNIDVFDDEVFEKVNKLCLSYHWNEFSDQKLDFGKILADFLRKNIDFSNRKYKVEFLQFMNSNGTIINDNSKVYIDNHFTKLTSIISSISDSLKYIGKGIKDILGIMESIDNEIIKLTPSLSEDEDFKNFSYNYERSFDHFFQSEDTFGSSNPIKLLTMNLNLKEIQKKYKVPLSSNDIVEIIQTYFKRGFVKLIDDIEYSLKHNINKNDGSLFESIHERLFDYCNAFDDFSTKIDHIKQSDLKSQLLKLEQFSKKSADQNKMYDNNSDRANDLIEKIKGKNISILSNASNRDDCLGFSYADEIFDQKYSYLFKPNDHKYTNQDIKYLENYLAYVERSSSINDLFKIVKSSISSMYQNIREMKEACKKNEKILKYKARIEKFESGIYSITGIPKTYGLWSDRDITKFFQKDIDENIHSPSEIDKKEPFKDYTLPNNAARYYNNLHTLSKTLDKHFNDIVEYRNKILTDPNAGLISAGSTPQPTMTKDQAKDLLKQEKFLEKLKRIAIDQPLTWISRKIQSLRNWADRGLKETEKNKGFINLLKKAIYKAISFLSSLLGAKKDRDVKSIDYTKHKTYDAFKGWR